MPNYQISGDTLTAIADKTRAMAGRSTKLTPSEIIYWLGRVKYIPQGYAYSEVSMPVIDVETIATPRLPDVAKSNAVSVLTMVSPTVETIVVGEIVESETTEEA